MAKCQAVGESVPDDLLSKRKELRRRLSRLDRVEEHRRLTRLKVRPVGSSSARR